MSTAQSPDDPFALRSLWDDPDCKICPELADGDTCADHGSRAWRKLRAGIGTDRFSLSGPVVARLKRKTRIQEVAYQAGVVIGYGILSLIVVVAFAAIYKLAAFLIDWILL